MNSGLLSIKEVAELLQSKESTVRTWIKRGQIPSHLIFKIGATVSILFKWKITTDYTQIFCDKKPATNSSGLVFASKRSIE